MYVHNYVLHMYKCGDLCASHIISSNKATVFVIYVSYIYLSMFRSMYTEINSSFVIC